MTMTPMLPLFQYKTLEVRSENGQTNHRQEVTSALIDHTAKGWEVLAVETKAAGTNFILRRIAGYR